jgi:hypothetical protein
MYTLRHDGHDLIVKRLRKSDQIKGYEKKYEIYIDGVLTDKGWNTVDSQRKAMRIAETLAPGEPVPTLASRQGQTWAADVDEPPTRAQAALEAIQQVEADSVSEPVPTQARAGETITYALAGVAGDTTDAIADIRAAVDLLRRHGQVQASVTMPRVSGA